MIHNFIGLAFVFLFTWLFVASSTVLAEAPTDEQLLELERQIEQQEAEQADAKKRAEAEAKRKAEEETRRKAEEERIRQEEEAKRLAEEEVKKAESVKQSSLLAGEFVDIPGGSFQMGSDKGGTDEQPVHAVTLQPFKLGKYEVTQAQWRTVMGNNPSNFSACDDCPVETVSWDDVQGFIQKLNQQTGGHYRLPSEAEWEYACRSGGRPEEYCGGNSPEALGWYGDNSGGKTHPVGQKSANGLGLYDMSGNVWEWTQDCWNGNYNGAPADGAAWQSDECGLRVWRGGSWGGQLGGVRSAQRSGSATAFRIIYLGFRLVQDLD